MLHTKIRRNRKFQFNKTIRFDLEIEDQDRLVQFC